VEVSSVRVGRPGAPLILIGASDQALVVLDQLGRLGVDDDVTAVLDATEQGTHLGRRVGHHQVLDTVGELTSERFRGTIAIPAIGAADLRESIHSMVADAGLRLGTVVDPTSVVSPTAVLGAGVVVAARAFVGPAATIGDGAIVNTGAIVEHHVRVGPFAHIGPGAVLAGHVRVGRGSTVGAGACVRDEIEIAADVTVGLGAAVINDLPASSIVVGVPARPIGGQRAPTP
jgi:sugar O-acyltransferase (sialic acid O-acetyltransferase NeuD family)